MGTSAQVQRYNRKTEERKFSDTQVPAKTGSKLIQGEKPVKIKQEAS